MDSVNVTDEEVIITKFGKPVAKLIPIKKEELQKPIFGHMKDSIIIHGDIIAPTGKTWDSKKTQIQAISP